MEDEAAERHATWTELFYDLVFVVAVAQLAARLLDNVTWAGAFAFTAYFIPVWWAWAGYTFYADRYDTDDLGQRTLAVAQMGAVVAMAASLGGEGPTASLAFAASYLASRAILVAMYVRARQHVPETRELVTGYIKGFSLEMVFWMISLFVPEPARFWLWGVGLAISFATPYVMRKIQAKVPLDVAHLPERFGLFTILVLGESMAAVVAAISHEDWSFELIIAGALAVAIAAGLWWVYFDNLQGAVVRRSAEQKKAWRPTVWIYAHLPLVIGLTAAGVGLEELVLAAAGHELERGPIVLVSLSIAMAFAMMAVISMANDVATSGNRPERTRALWRIGAAVTVLLLALFMEGASALVLLSLLGLVCLVEVMVDVSLNTDGS